jgi:hypothetical protein
MVYELYILRDGRWGLDTLYDDKETAIADARRVMASAAPPSAVQVVEDGGMDADGRVVFKKKQGGFATLREIRSAKLREAASRSRQMQQRKAEAEAEAERQRRARRQKLIVIGVLLTAALVSGSMWFGR